MSPAIPELPWPHEAGLAIDPHHPWHIVHQGYTVLVTRPDGTLEGKGLEGLYDFDTRILSRHRLALDGVVPEYVDGGALDTDRWAAHLRVGRTGGDAVGPALPQDALVVTLDRRLGRAMEERIVVRNHSMTPGETELSLELEADFADVQEAEGEGRQRGEVNLCWSADSRSLLFDYQARVADHGLHRALRVRVVEADSEPSCSGSTIRFSLKLPPRGSWGALLRFGSLVDGEWREPLDESSGGGTERDRIRERWRRRRMHVHSPHHLLCSAVEHAAEDLFALRSWEFDEAEDAWFTMAGVPTYTGIFGRDSLTAAWQAGSLGPEMLRGALIRIARTQARGDSAWHDKEPGKLIHEMRRGPLSELGIIPQRAYYGTQTTPAMFVLALSEYWNWTGDDRLLRRLRDTALRTFEWAERHGDLDGDGFLEYRKRSTRGLKNHAWKDSDEAIRYPDGSLVENPIATVEEQAYHFIALQRMAEVLLALGEEDRADSFLERARLMKQRLNEAFWVEEDRFYAMALDGHKRTVRSIGSNPGHLLATGALPLDRARAVADRLMSPELFSGWGVRTLSAEHPSYNPFGYHLGTVWPVENATFALGFKRYGFDEHVERLVTALLAASGHFRNFRLPEALAGYSRDESPTPSAYPRTNSPQAWSASATVQLVQIMLGLFPFAPGRILALVHPRLPAWLPEIVLHNVRVGNATVSLRFRRKTDGTTTHDVIEKKGRLLVIETAPPDGSAGDESWLDRAGMRLLAHAPGRTARALKIALGRIA